MNIYLITQEVNVGYDTYDSAVVYANSAEEARNIHPSGGSSSYFMTWAFKEEENGEYSIDSESVKAELIGVASNKDAKPGVICASFNAG